jgi:hypothetical protein
LSIGWDDACPGLTATLTREAEWKCQEEHNDKEVVSWAVEAPDSWGNAPPTSPVSEEGWPGIRPEDRCFPHLEDLLLGPDGWPEIIQTPHKPWNITASLTWKTYCSVPMVGQTSQYLHVTTRLVVVFTL